MRWLALAVCLVPAVEALSFGLRPGATLLNRLPPTLVTTNTTAANVCCTTFTITITATVAEGLHHPLLVITAANNCGNTGAKSPLDVQNILVNGVAATERKSAGSTTEVGPYTRVELWTARPSPGTNTVLFVWAPAGQSAGDRNAICTVQQWQHVHPDLPIAADASATTGIDVPVNYSADSAQEWAVVDATGARSDHDLTRAGTGQSVHGPTLQGSAGGGIRAAGSYHPRAAVATVNYTDANGDSDNGTASVAVLLQGTRR